MTAAALSDTGKKAGGAASIVAHRKSLVLASRTRFNLDHYCQTGNSSTDLYAWCSLGFTIELCHHLSWAQIGMSIFCYWVHWCQSLFDTVSLLFLRLYCVCEALFFVSVYMLAVKKSCKLIWHPRLYAVRIIHSCHANFRPVNNVMQRKRNKNMTCTWHLMQNVLNWCDLQKCFSCQRSALTCVIKNVRPWACFWKQDFQENFWISAFYLHLVSSTVWIQCCVVEVWAKCHTRHSITTLEALLWEKKKKTHQKFLGKVFLTSQVLKSGCY